MMVIKNQVQAEKPKIYGTKDFSLTTLINMTFTYNTLKSTQTIFSLWFSVFTVPDFPYQEMFATIWILLS